MAIVITTTSSTQYMSDKDNAIYPPFVDNMPYEAWVGPNPAIRQPYFQFRATGGTTYTWSIASGSLPPGLELLPDGKLQGTEATKKKVTQEGTYTFTVSVTSDGETAQKTLTIKSEPYRGKRIDDVKLGFVVHWGRFSEPKLSDVATSDAAFRARATEFSAVEWVSEIKRLGGRALHFTAIWQDSFRNWPSTTPTRLELKSQRNWVQELINECHAQGILFITYFCPDYFSNPIGITDGSLATNAWGSMNNGLIAELVDMGVDGFWYDIGAAPELFASVDPNWLYFYNTVLPYTRKNNPYCTISINSGILMGGIPVRYPDTDVLSYEGYPNSASASTLEIARPNVLEKKMGIEVDTMLGRSWAYGTIVATQSFQDPKAIIKHLEQNWKLGNTVFLALPVPANGKFLSPPFVDAVNEIGVYAAARLGYSTPPAMTYANGHVSIDVPLNSRTYYTTNGKLPTGSDNVYVAPIKVDKNTLIRAVTTQPSLPDSKPVDLIVGSGIAVAGFSNLITAEPAGNAAAKDAAGYFRGMRITVGRSPVIINRIGRREISPMTGTHRIQLRRYHDHWPLFVGDITLDHPVVDGYRWIDIPEIELAAGMGYLIMTKENNTDDYARNNFSEIPITRSVRIVKNAQYSVVGEKIPLVADAYGQILNLSIKQKQNKRSDNVLLGKPSEYRNLSGTLLIPSGGRGFPENAVDGDASNRAQPGGSYNFEHFFDLGKIRPIHRIKMGFFVEAFSTNFTVYASMDKVERIPIFSRSNNTETSFLADIDPIVTRWIIVRSNAPNAPGQLGYQMNIVEIEAY